MDLAYIDPGTGFILLNTGGWLIAAIVGFFGIGIFYLKKILNFIKNHKRLVALISALLLGSIIGGVFFFMKNNEHPLINQKIIILGIDGLSPKIVESLMEAGKLPHFSRLKSEGSYRELATTNPPQSPVAWAAFSTGKNPGKTGICRAA